MSYLLIVTAVFFMLLYIACAYLIYRFVSSKNPGIYQGLSGIKKVFIMMLMPILAIVMAAIQFLSQERPKKEI